MTPSHDEQAADQKRDGWRVGQRVARKDTRECGTVTETDGNVKVKWDGGRTSYFRHGDTANVQLEKIWHRIGTGQDGVMLSLAPAASLNTD